MAINAGYNLAVWDRSGLPAGGNFDADFMALPSFPNSPDESRVVASLRPSFYVSVGGASANAPLHEVKFPAGHTISQHWTPLMINRADSAFAPQQMVSLRVTFWYLARYTGTHHLAFDGDGYTDGGLMRLYTTPGSDTGAFVQADKPDQVSNRVDGPPALNDIDAFVAANNTNLSFAGQKGKAYFCEIIVSGDDEGFGTLAYSLFSSGDGTSWEHIPLNEISHSAFDLFSAAPLPDVTGKACATSTISFTLTNPAGEPIVSDLINMNVSAPGTVGPVSMSGASTYSFSYTPAAAGNETITVDTGVEALSFVMNVASCTATLSYSCTDAEQSGGVGVADWGDATPATTISPMPFDGVSRTLSHTYANPGTYIITLSADDQQSTNNTASVTTPVTI